MQSIEFVIAPLVKTSTLIEKPIQEIAKQYCVSLLESKIVTSLEEVVRVLIQSDTVADVEWNSNTMTQNCWPCDDMGEGDFFVTTKGN
uniref:Uncharacterized protein n=1 Tax=Caenorhabditis japonica TaxID=281687 RepID=A0A8R1IJG7_CAEJA